MNYNQLIINENHFSFLFKFMIDFNYNIVTKHDSVSV